VRRGTGSAAGRPKHVSLYPLYGTPLPWPVPAGDLEHLTGLPRIVQNLVPFEWGDSTSTFAPIFVYRDDPWVALRLARLSQDVVERVDIKKLQEDLLAPGDGQYFADSAHLLIDTKSGLAIGEYKPTAVGILGDRPSLLLNRALSAASRPERVELHPFPSPKFREVVLGKAIKKYTLKLGPASAAALEQEGFGSEAVRRIIEHDTVVGVDITIAVEAAELTDEKRAGVLETIAEKLGRHRAKTFRITTEEHVSFDLLRQNLTRYDVQVSLSAKDGPGAERKAVLGAMREALQQHRDELLDMIPKGRVRKLSEFGSL
jgi:hypothetical protein